MQGIPRAARNGGGEEGEERGFVLASALLGTPSRSALLIWEDRPANKLGTDLGTNQGLNLSLFQSNQASPMVLLSFWLKHRLRCWLLELIILPNIQ